MSETVNPQRSRTGHHRNTFNLDIATFGKVFATMHLDLANYRFVTVLSDSGSGTLVSSSILLIHLVHSI